MSLTGSRLRIEKSILGYAGTKIEEFSITFYVPSDIFVRIGGTDLLEFIPFCKKSSHCF